MNRLFYILLCLSVLASCSKYDVEPSPYSQEDMDFNARIQHYMESSFTSEITGVAVGEDNVTISGHYRGQGSFHIADIPPYTDLLGTDAPLTTVPQSSPAMDVRSSAAGKDFTLTLDRKVTADGGISYDRLLSKWAIFESGEN